MKTVGAFEAKSRLGQLLDAVERGEEVVITRHGREVARLMPIKSGGQREQALAALQRLRERAKHLKRGAFKWDECAHGLASLGRRALGEPITVLRHESVAR